MIKFCDNIQAFHKPHVLEDNFHGFFSLSLSFSGSFIPFLSVESSSNSFWFVPRYFPCKSSYIARSHANKITLHSLTHLNTSRHVPLIQKLCMQIRFNFVCKRACIQYTYLAFILRKSIGKLLTYDQCVCVFECVLSQVDATISPNLAAFIHSFDYRH